MISFRWVYSLINVFGSRYISLDQAYSPIKLSTPYSGVPWDNSGILGVDSPSVVQARENFRKAIAYFQGKPIAKRNIIIYKCTVLIYRHLFLSTVHVLFI